MPTSTPPSRPRQPIWIAALTISLSLLLFWSFFINLPQQSPVQAGIDNPLCGQFIPTGSTTILRLYSDDFLPLYYKPDYKLTGFPVLLMWQGVARDFNTGKTIPLPTDPMDYRVFDMKAHDIIDIAPVNTALGVVTKAIVGTHRIALAPKGGCQPNVTPPPPPTTPPQPTTQPTTPPQPTTQPTQPPQVTATRPPTITVSPTITVTRPPTLTVSPTITATRPATQTVSPSPYPLPTPTPTRPPVPPGLGDNLIFLCILLICLLVLLILVLLFFFRRRRNGNGNGNGSGNKSRFST